MLEKLAQIEENYEELNNQLSSPDIMSDISAYTKLMKQHRSLGEIVKKYRELKKTQEELDGAKEIVAATEDAEMREFAELEIAELEENLKKGDEDLKFLLIDQRVLRNQRTTSGKPFNLTFHLKHNYYYSLRCLRNIIPRET
jgi:peptide chain release factor 1